MRSLRRRFLVVSILAAGFATALHANGPKDLVAIPQSAQQLLVAHDEKVTFKASAFFLAEWDAKQQSDMTALGIPFKIIFHDVNEQQTFYLFELHDGEEPPAAWTTLYRQGRNVIVPMSDAEAGQWSLQGQHAVRLWHEPHGWGRSAAPLVAYDCTSKPLISGILDKTSQSQWMDWIEKLSGVESINIGGTTYTIATRFTTTMFSGAANAKGFEFVKQQAQAWGFSGANYEEDPFATGPSGKNLVLTLPGQTTDEVILSAHLDSIFQAGDSTTSAPGANDNGTGTATVLEAARLLRQYRFQRTIRLILFTGEEQGLFGSAAYANDHSLTSVLGVLNLDMFGYDSNADRCFEVHAGTLPASIDIGNCFAGSIGSYALGLSRDFLTTTATDRSDHASFWNHGTGAIEIAENFFNDNQAGGCVGADANPFYHTNNDRISTNMTPSYAISIAKAGLATIAAMAIPIDTCFAGAPAISANGAPNRVDVAWPALGGAAKYRVYRSTNGCGGNFVSIGETVSPSYMDPLTTPGGYSYKVEAVTVDSCYSLESNCATATPITSPSVTYQAGSAVVVDDTGDHDLIPDNCETVTVQLNLVNDGNQDLTNVKIASVSSTHPGVQVVGTVPENVVSLATGQSAPAKFKFRLGENGNAALCNEAIPLTVFSSSDQSGPIARSLSLTAEAQGAVGITNASSISCDALSNVCAALPAEVSPVGSPVPFTIAKAGASLGLQFSESAGATSYSLHSGSLASLHGGAYDHDAAGVLCGLTDASPGDGSVSAVVTLPDDSYTLVVGANGSGESPYGSATAGPIPVTLDTCP